MRIQDSIRYFYEMTRFYCFKKNITIDIALTPSRMEATAKTVEAETSSSLFLIELIRLAAVSFNPGRTSQKRSVLAVHKMITYIKI